MSGICSSPAPAESDGNAITFFRVASDFGRDSKDSSVAPGPSPVGRRGMSDVTQVSRTVNPPQHQSQ